MPVGEPFIPRDITVHLGRPEETANNVTVSFPDYIKNVVSSEIYPTWPENAIRANIYVIVSFALNRVYTEWYRSRGYPFDITNSTQFDQKYIYGREIFENVGQLVDELFNSYVRRQGNVEPLFTAFCNGTTVTCDGLSQWGTVPLAQQGMTPYEILTTFYGNDIDIVTNVPVMTNTPSYPGFDLRLGLSDDPVRTIQVQLNRISRNYPAIPKIGEAAGDFDYITQDAVIAFQEIFGLPATGIVNEATWYRISYIFTSVKNLAELNSEGITQQEIEQTYTEDLHIGMQGKNIRALQYHLAVVGAYYAAIQPVEITGYFGEQTETSVKSLQQAFGLPVTGVVDFSTWNALYDAYTGIVESIPLDTSVNDVVLYPGVVLREGTTSEYVRLMQQYLTYIHGTYPEIPAVNATGYFGPMTKSAVMAFQELFGYPKTGVVGTAVWNAIASLYSDLKYGYDKQPFQAPGYIIT